MVRVRGLKISFLIVAVILVFTCLCIPASAVDVIGLNVSDNTLERGDTVDVVILSPVLPDNADSANIKVYYDADVFDVVSSTWDVDISGDGNRSRYSIGTNSDENGTFFALAAASGNYNTATRLGGIEVGGKQIKFMI